MGRVDPLCAGREPQQEEDVAEPFYVSRAQVWKVAGLHRRARLETGVEFDMGVHGAIKEYYRLEAPDQPLPVDYMVALTGG